MFPYHTDRTAGIDKDMWIGLTDEADEGAFVWEDGSTVS